MIIKAKKSLGQNFLFDKQILEIISNCAEIKDKDILEVGPGTGYLTNEILLKKPKNFFVVEKDKNLLELLKKKFKDKIIYIHDDILKISEKKISQNKLTVFGNLPYNISTEILTKWIVNLNSVVWFDKLILMFQKEVANRIIAKYNTSSYGRLSIISNWRLEIKKIIDIKPHSFKPSPKVDSTLLVLKLKENFFKFDNINSLENVTKIFFNQRRKKIKKPLNQLFYNVDEIVKKYKISLDLRPQNLDNETYYLITKEFENLRS